MPLPGPGQQLQRCSMTPFLVGRESTGASARHITDRERAPLRERPAARRWLVTMEMWLGEWQTFVHVTSGTPASSCTAYSNTATLSATNHGSLQASATTTVQCPSLSISKTHAGNFTQGQTGATYTVTVSEQAGTGPTFGTVTVTENLPAGLNLVSMSGAGWTCPGTAANNCTRSDVLAAGASYPAITVTVNVASNAGSPLLNSVSVSGGGSSGSSASDSTVINVVQAGPPLRSPDTVPRADTRDPTGHSAAQSSPAIPPVTSTSHPVPAAYPQPHCRIP